MIRSASIGTLDAFTLNFFAKASAFSLVRLTTVTSPPTFFSPKHAAFAAPPAPTIIIFLPFSSVSFLSGSTTPIQSVFVP